MFDGVYADLNNGEPTPLLSGEIVRVSGEKLCLRAQANSALNVAGLCGVVISGVVPSGRAYVAQKGKIPVLMEPGLTVAGGDTVYVSTSTAGRGTNVAAAGRPSLGTITDTSQYARTGAVVCILTDSGAGGIVGPRGATGVAGATGATGAGDQRPPHGGAGRL